MANVPEQVTVLAQSTHHYEAGKIKLQWESPSTFETVGNEVQTYYILKDVGSGVFYTYDSVEGKTLQYVDTGLIEG